MASITTPPRARKDSYYTEEVDFAELAKQDDDFAALYNTNGGRIDWQDPKAVQQVTKTLLRRDFDLTLTLPPDRLCPPVPVRWNYIRWLQDLLDTTSATYTSTPPPSRKVLGLDIGVGASCIYSLLACSSRPNWRMLGSDVDQHSLDFARQNVDANKMDDRIKPTLTTTDAPLIPIEKMGIEHLDFVMCNPPFYSSDADMLTAYGSKLMPPSAVCTGAETEMICPGGDVGFVTRMIDESLKLKTKVQWYSSMLGRLVSAHQVVAKLKSHGITNFAVTNLKAGQKTRRWAVAWSFSDFRPRNDVARHGDLVMGLLPPATAWTIEVESAKAEELGKKVDATLRALDLRWQWRAGIHTGLAAAKGNVWSRAARRKRKFEEVSGGGQKASVAKGDGMKEGHDEDDEEDEDEDEDEDEEVGLAVKIACSDAKVDLCWLRGNDHLLFESFHGMLKRAVGARTPT